MSKQICTYGQLQRLTEDMTALAKNHPAFEILNREKIKRFKVQNNLHIDRLIRTREKIFGDNIKKDENGKFKTITVTLQASLPEPEKKSKWWKSKSKPAEQPKPSTREDWDFISPDHKKAFEETTEQFLSQSFELYL